MQQEQFELFVKYYAGETSEKENEEVKLLIEKDKKTEEAFYSLKQSWENSLKLKSDFKTEHGLQLLKGKIKKKEKHNRRTIVLRIAAIFIGLIAVGTILVVDYSQYTTVFADTEVQKIMLPDSSVIYLNKGAELKYSTAKLKRFNRRVSLKGEGYFEVKKDSRKFVVQTHNFDVQVLGTKFNINTNEANSEIALTEGNVRLYNFYAKRNDIYMAPNDFVSYNAASQTAKQFKINAKLYTVWKDKYISFDDFSLEEVGKIIEKVFNKTVVIKNADFANKKLSGTAPTDNLNDLTTALSEILGKQIQTQNDTIIIK